MSESTSDSESVAATASQRWFVLGPVRVDLLSGVVHRDDAVERLSGRELHTLLVLIRADGQPVRRSTLERDVWGQHEGVTSEAVPAAMRRLRQKLESDASDVRHLVTVRGVGWLLQHGQLTNHPRQPIRALLVPPAQTWGRVADVERIRLAVEQPGLTTITGPPGIGKTHLCLTTAHTVASRTDRRVLAFASLSTVTDIRGIWRELLGSLEMTPNANPEQQLRDAVERHPSAVLFLDNAEHIVQATREVVAALVSASAALSIVVTSRVTLELEHERVVRLDGLGAIAARRLFVATAQRLQFPVDDADAVGAIVEHVQGNPLALQLAAGQLHVRSLRDLALSLQTPPTPLCMPRANSDMEVAVASSWERLTPAQQNTLSLLMVTQVSVDVDTAMTTTHTDHPGILTSLVQASLLQRIVSPSGTVHLWPYMVVRDWIVRHPDPGRDAAETRYRRHLSAQAAEMAGRLWANDSVEAREWLAHYHAELERFESSGHLPLKVWANCLIGLASWALHSGRADRVVRRIEQYLNTHTPSIEVASHLTLWRIRLLLPLARIAEGVEVVTPDLLAVPSTHVAIRAELGLLQYQLRDLSAARETLAIPLRGLEPHLRCRIMAGNAFLADLEGRPDQAVQQLEKAIAVSESIGHHRLSGWLRTRLGTMLERREDHGEAAARQFRISADHFRISGALTPACWSVARLAFALAEMGTLDAAEPVFEEAMTLADRIGSRFATGVIASNFSALQMQRARWEDAERLTRLAASQFDDSEPPDMALICAGNRGILHLVRGETSTASAVLRAVSAQIEDPDNQDAYAGFASFAQAVDGGYEVRNPPQTDGGREVHAAVRCWLAHADGRTADAVDGALVAQATTQDGRIARAVLNHLTSTNGLKGD